MGREVHWFDEHSCYVVRWSATATPESLLEHWKSVAEDPRFEPGLAALHDCRGFAVVLPRDLMRDSAHVYRAEVEPRVGFGRVAILADNQESQENAQRMLDLLELEDAIVTTSEAEARDWVGLPADVFVPDGPLAAEATRPAK